MLFRTELYKICSRKIIYVGFLLCFLFLAFYFQVSVLGNEYVYEDGRCLRRTEAIEKNREIARSYAGPLTREKAREIVAAYGWAANHDDITLDEKTGNTDPGYYENSTSRFVTDKLSNKRVQGEVPDSLASEDDPFASNLMGGNYQYGYIGAWDSSFTEIQMMLYLMLSILVIIGCSSSFSEEYSGKTAAILLTSKNGKGKTAAAKIAAAFAYTGGLYLISIILMGGAFLYFYGTEGWSVSAQLVFTSLLTSDIISGTVSHITVGSVLTLYVFLGLVSLLLTAAITLCLSSRKKTSFSALIWSLAVFLLPLVMQQIILSMLRPGRIVTLLRLVFSSMPFYLPIFGLEYLPYGYRLFSYIFPGSLLILCCIQCNRSYCRYQIGK